MKIKIISLAATGTLLKALSLERFMHHRRDNILHEGHLLTDANIQMHSAPEENESYEGNLDEKFREAVLTLHKLENGQAGSLDHYLPYHFAFESKDVLSGRTRIPIWVEDSGLTFPQINGQIRQLIIEHPEKFGEMAELAKGLITDPQIYKSFDNGFPGVETSPVLSSLGKEGFIKFIHKCAEILGCETDPQKLADIDKALKVTQHSYLTYFLWYPGMKIDIKNLGQIPYERARASSSGLFTSRALNSQDVFELDDCIIPLELAKNGDFKTATETGDFYYKGPNCRWDAFEKMVNRICAREYLIESLGTNYKHSKRERSVIREKDLSPRSYDLTLITHDHNNPTIKNRLAARLPSGYTIKQFASSDLLKAKSKDELYENLCHIDQLLNSSDCFVFEPIPPNLPAAEFSAISAMISSIITYKLTAPAHKNKQLIFLNDNGCYNEILGTLNAMAKRNSLADYIQYGDEKRLGIIAPSANTDELYDEVLISASRYSRVDIYNHGAQIEPEAIRYYQPEQGENVTSMLFSAGLRGAYYELSYELAKSYLTNGDTVNWGLGDKISMMGAAPKARDDLRKQGIEARITGSSTIDILTGETMNGKGVPGVKGRIYRSLIPRTLDVLAAGKRHFSSGGAGSLFELDVDSLATNLGFENIPTTISTFDKDDPMRLAAERRLGKPNDSLHYLDGTIPEQVAGVIKIIKSQKNPDHLHEENAR